MISDLAILAWKWSKIAAQKKYSLVLGPRSILFEFLDSLRKSYGKEVISDLAILAWKWSKIAARKK